MIQNAEVDGVGHRGLIGHGKQFEFCSKYDGKLLDYPGCCVEKEF